MRVRVYAGIETVSKKKHYLTEVVPAGPKAAKEAERVRTRLLNQVDENRSPRTRATVNQLMDR
jgi:integrase